MSCGRQRPRVLRGVRLELDVELEAADAREVVLLGIEEHPLEQVLGRLVGRRIAGAQAPVDLEDRLVLGLVGVLADRVDEDVAREVPVREEELDLLDAALLESLDRVRAELLARPRTGPRRSRGRRRRPGSTPSRRPTSSTERSIEPFLAISFWSSPESLMPGEDRLRLALDARVPVLQLLLLEDVLADRQVGAAALEARGDGRVELPQDRLVGLEAERAQEDRRRELALPVDPDEQDRPSGRTRTPPTSRGTG